MGKTAKLFEAVRKRWMKLRPEQPDIVEPRRVGPCLVTGGWILAEFQ